MARRKNKKRARPDANQDVKPALRNSDQTKSHDTPTASSDAAPKTTTSPRKQVSLFTCIAGMFLTLILGLYLGSLVPDIKNSFQHKNGTEAQRPAPAKQAPDPALAAVETVSPPAPPQQAAPAVPPRLAEHISQLEKKVAMDPGNSGNWTDLGNAYFDTSQHDMAIHAYEHALEISPDNPDVLTDLGIMHREKGNYEKALEYFRKASSVDPHHVNSLFNEGVVLGHDLGRKEECVAVWNKILAFSPDARTPSGRPLADVINEMR